MKEINEKNKEEEKRDKKKWSKKIFKNLFLFSFLKNIKQYNNIQQQYNQQQYNQTMQQQDNLPPRISDSHFIHTQTVTCTTKHFGNDMIL